MKARTRLFAALAVPVLAGTGVLAAAGGAHAATGYTDTSVQGSNFVFQHHITGTAEASGSTVTEVYGLKSVPGPGNQVTWSLGSSSDVNGVTLSVTSSNLIEPDGAVISAEGHLNGGSGTAVHTVVKLDATDPQGDVAVVSVPVTVSNNSVSYDTANADELTTDEVYDISITDNNPDGSVAFAAKNTLDTATTITETNLPAGLVSGNPLEPGTAVPGTYKDQVVKATDASGATATGTFLLKVNGSATPVAPVPVLSHGAAVYVAATREDVYVQTTISTWVQYTIVGPGAINGHVGWVYLNAGSTKAAVYSGLEANHGYTVFYKPVLAQGSTTQVAGTRIGYVYFVSNRPDAATTAYSPASIRSLYTRAA